jgi:hypothetical protein
MGIMGYALYTYHWRSAQIRTGGRGPYDDRLGPVNAISPYKVEFVTDMTLADPSLHCSSS